MRRILDVLLGRYGTLPIRSALSIAVETLKDIYETTILAWTVPFYQFVSGGTYRDLAIATVVAARGDRADRAVGPAHTDHGGPATTPGISQRQLDMIAIGAVIVVFALLPIDLAGRNVLFADQWDRYTLYASSGVALIVGAAVFRYLRGQARTLVLLTLVGMSVYVHYFSAASVSRLLVLAARSLAAAGLARTGDPQRDNALCFPAGGRLPGGIRDLRSRQHGLLPGQKPADRRRRDQRGYRHQPPTPEEPPAL